MAGLNNTVFELYFGNDWAAFWGLFDDIYVLTASCQVAPNFLGIDSCKYMAGRCLAKHESCHLCVFLPNILLNCKFGLDGESALIKCA